MPRAAAYSPRSHVCALQRLQIRVNKTPRRLEGSKGHERHCRRQASTALENLDVRACLAVPIESKACAAKVLGCCPPNCTATHSTAALPPSRPLPCAGMASEIVQMWGELHPRLTRLLDQLESARGDPYAGKRLLKEAADFQRVTSTLFNPDTTITPSEDDDTIRCVCPAQ